MCKLHGKLLLERIAQLPQSDKIFSRCFSFLRERRNCHQTLNRQSVQREQRLHSVAQLVRLKSELTPLARHVHFEKNAWMQSFFFRDAVHVLCKRRRIDAMDNFKQRQRMPDLIFLEMTDEMPAQVWRHLWHLRARFLDAALA